MKNNSTIDYTKATTKFLWALTILFSFNTSQLKCIYKFVSRLYNRMSVLPLTLRLCLVLVLGVGNVWGQTVVNQNLRGGSLPTGWSQTDVTFTTAASGYANFTSTSAVLTTPVFNSSANTSVTVSFNVAKWGSGTNGPITVEYSTDGGSSWITQGNSSTPTSSTYLPNTITIPTASATMLVRFTRGSSPSRKRLRDVEIIGVGTSGGGSSGGGGGCSAIFSDNFSGTLAAWSNTTDWTISSGELRHDATGQSESYIYSDIGTQDLSLGDYEWEVCIRNGNWDPSGGNDFTYYLLSSNSNVRTSATGYAVGVNRTGSSDLLTLYSVSNGSHTAIITSTFNWDANDDVCIRVTRSSAGAWELFYDDSGSGEVSGGTTTNTTHTTGQYIGAFFDFTSSRAGFLWFDDVSVCSTSSSSAPEVGFDSASSTVNETNATFTINIPVTLSNFSSNVNLSVSVDGSSTAEASDYTLNTTSLSFTGNGTQNISLDINPDAGYDDETIILEIAETTSTGVTITTSQHTVTILDDETAPLGWQITVEDTDFVIDFDNSVAGVNNGQFDGSGFSPSPITGQLNSQAWETTGMSDGISTNFGDTETSGDFARGSSTGGVVTGGFYAFETSSNDFSLGFQASTADFTPGTITLRAQNQTGETVNNANLSYILYVFNDQGRANSFNFSYSTDGSNYTTIPSLDFTSAEVADGSPVWVSNAKGEFISGLSIADGEHLYLRWESDDVSGGGSRDELAIDDITLNFNPTSPLPVELISFDATVVDEQKSVVLEWETESEQNNDYFTLYHSTNGKSFEQIGRVSGSGNTSSLLSYTFEHREPRPGINYYKLTSTDYDGTIHDKGIVAVLVEMNHVFYDQITQSIQMNYSSDYAIYGSDGRLIARVANQNVIPFSGHGVFHVIDERSGKTFKLGVW